MDFSPLRELEEMFASRGDALALVCLIDAPMRYADLRRAISTRVGDHLSDNQLGRALTRLVTNGLVNHVDVEDGIKVYQLTDAGRRNAEILRFVSDQLLRRRDEQDADQPGPALTPYEWL